MIKYSIVLLAAVAVFNGCSSSECCEKGIAPVAVIAGLGAGETLVADSFTLGDGGSSDSDGTVSSRTWTVGGIEVENGYTLPVGTHDVCLLVTDNDGLTDKTCGKVTINEVENVAPTATVTASSATCIADEDVILEGTSADAEDGTVDTSTYVWSPNTNITGSGASVTYVCPASGSQEVCLTVTDSGGQESAKTSSSCTTITVDVAPVFGLAKPVATGGDGYNILCSSNDTNITIGLNTDIQEVYWKVAYNMPPSPVVVTDWNQTAWNDFDSKADHFCGKWVGGGSVSNPWIIGAGNTIDINATVVDNNDDNITYQFTIGSDGNITVVN